jgi:hypothetical protein
MNAENAKLVNNTIAVFVLSYCLLVLMDKASVKNKIDIINNNNRFLSDAPFLQ